MQTNTQDCNVQNEFDFFSDYLLESYNEKEVFDNIENIGIEVSFNELA